MEERAIKKDAKKEIISLNIGSKIKLLRKDRQFTLQDLSDRTGFSKPLLSQVENSFVIPPLPTLLKISKALRVPLTYFITEGENRVTVVRSKELEGAPKRFVEGRDPAIHKYLSLVEGRTSKKMEPIFMEVSRTAKDNGAQISHHGDEFVYVLEGQLEVLYGDATFVLNPGDSLYMDGRVPHSYRSLTKKRTKALMVLAE